jgi:hypothetical protein
MEISKLGVYMAHFAELDGSNVVQRVMVVDNVDCLDGDGNESEAVGVAFCDALFGGGTWKQTSYNNNIRKQYAGEGYTYDASLDIFIEAQIFASWTLDGSGAWQPPISYPSDYGTEGKWYHWDEDAYQADNSTGWVAK